MRCRPPTRLPCVDPMVIVALLIGLAAGALAVLVAVRPALVERAALHCQLGLDPRERTFELDDLLHATPPLEERWAHGYEDSERTRREADKEGNDDHRVDAR